MPIDNNSNIINNNYLKDMNQHRAPAAAQLDAATHYERSRCCFQKWMQLQQEDLAHLIEFLHNHHNNNNHDDNKDNNEEEIKILVRSCITHFEEYIFMRSCLAEEDASPFFAPMWCTSLENSLLWIAGCRPTIFIRLIYALTGFEVDARLNAWLQGIRNSTDRNNLCVGDLSPDQLMLVNDMHIRTIRAEERLTNELASSQEDLADQPIAVIANAMEVVGDMNEETEMILKNHETEMREIMEKADALRLNTLKEVVEILKPIQAVEFLVASKKLHLSIHQWGIQKDERHGRRYNY